VRGLHKEAIQPRSDVDGIEVTMESFGCGARDLQALRLAVEKIDQCRSRPDRIVERPIPPLDAVVEEL